MEKFIGKAIVVTGVTVFVATMGCFVVVMSHAFW